ncbi:YbaK/EbsC family protein [Paenibacillus chartarius]|uniref:YbaK/EbsC family protein n=1 Tax=Paenibacillus chartarius TaxID=747481 RepID=A0ABV6DG09_9BACL
MRHPYKESIQQVQSALRVLGYQHQIVELPDDARTAQDAANAIGCSQAQIAKSIIFRLERSGRPLLVVASGVNRVDVQKASGLAGDTLAKADADFVREHTGFVIGGVAPVGHKTPLATFIDEDLLEFPTIWAAAGHPKAVFQLSPSELVAMTKGQVVNVCHRP